jgi:hypothetical protein
MKLTSEVLLIILQSFLVIEQKIVNQYHQDFILEVLMEPALLLQKHLKVPPQTPLQQPQLQKPLRMEMAITLSLHIRKKLMLLAQKLPHTLELKFLITIQEMRVQLIILRLWVQALGHTNLENVLWACIINTKHILMTMNSL